MDFLDYRRKVSINETVPNYEDIYIDEDESTIITESNQIDEGEGIDISAEQLSSDIFVEVGNLVTYCFIENPEDKHSVLIVDGHSNAKHNIINESTPVAQALLGLSVGEENGLLLPSGKEPTIRILKIQRQ